MNIKFEQVDSFGVLTFNRPKALNALNIETLEELNSHLENLPNIKGLILTGAGDKSFIAGADIKEMANMNDDQARSFSRLGQKSTLLIESLAYPVVSCINGYALGGGLEMALSSDFILASKNAKFALPELTLGLIPGFGGTQRLKSFVGMTVAKKMIFSGETITAEEAENNGLVLKVFENKEIMMEKGFDLCKKFSNFGRTSLKLAKRCLNEGQMASTEDGLKIENMAFAELFNCEESHEGMKAFLEKRKPKFD